jgi:uncharacterized protein YjbI with pentapeptide repeats
MPADEEQTLKLQQLQLTNEKLQEEVKKARLEAKPQSRWGAFAKYTVSIGGVVTILVSVAGIYDSFTKNLADREHTRVSEAKARIDEAVKLLSSDNSISKVAGIGVLSGYLDNSSQEFHHQILYTLAAAMAAEHDPQVETAILDLVEGIPSRSIIPFHNTRDLGVVRTVMTYTYSYLKELIDAGQPVDEVDTGPVSSDNWLLFLQTVISQNRSLVEKASLWTKRELPLGSPQSGSDEIIAQKLGRMIAIIARKNVLRGYRDYRTIYCVQCDFQEILFPDKVDFSGAILDGAKFTGATLPEAIFDNSSLFGTKFNEADLTNSKFRNLGDSESLQTKSFSYVLNSLVSEYQINLVLPNFSCADLSGTDFGSNTIFPAVITVKREYPDADAKNNAWYKTVPEAWKSVQSQEHNAINVKPIKLYNAKLDGANLKNAAYFSIYKGDPTDLISVKTPIAENSEGTIVQGPTLNAEIAFRKVPDPLNAKDLANSFQTYIRASMYKARDLEKANLPDGIAQFLDFNKPTETDFHNTYMRGRPSDEIDSDTKCSPRGK